MAKTEKIESFAGYVSFLEKNCKKEDILFRGQQRENPLLPKLARIKPKKRIRPTECTMLRDLVRQGLPHIEFDL
ncbi:hypothetical protein ES703_74092 [subsurface metagenome]